MRLDFGLIQGPYNNDIGTTSYVLLEANGTKHELRFTSNNIYRTFDSTRMEYKVNNKLLRLKDGTRITYEAVPNTADKFRPIEIKDTNGNYITITYKTFGHLNVDTVTDTLGRIITFTYDGSNRLTEVKQGTQTYATFTWGTHPLNYNFAPSLTVNAPTNGTQLNVVTKVTLANSLAYDFTWADWGMVNQVTVRNPNGSARSYVRYDLPSATSQQDDSPGFGNQFRSENGSPEVAWPFSFTKDAGKNVTTSTLTHPDGTLVVRDFFTTSNWKKGLLQTETVKQGSTALQTTTLAWTQDDTTLNYKKNPRVTSETATLNDTGQQSKHEFDYTTHGNVSEQREFDYGLVLVRKTKYFYLTTNPYDSRHIFDRVTRVEVYDAASVLKAKTEYEYDNYTAGITDQPAVQHDNAGYGPTFTYRGNVTAVKRWRNTDQALLTTRSQYDDTGNALSTTDPLNHNTSFSFADNFSDSINRNTFAYQTQVTNALGHITTRKYYFETGLPERQTDPNNQTTTYTYDAMFRPLVTSFPDGGQRSLSYDDNTPAVTETIKIDATQNLVRKTIFDGDGRVIQTQLLSDPEGVVYVDTTYDDNHRKASESNPYRSTGEATYGITQYQYDNLDRVSKVIPPDGSGTSNNVTYTYSGNCTTVTDQAGKKQKTCTDALGRTIQVWEPDATGSFIYETAYQYDVLDNLARVDQKGNDPNSANWRTRTFTYNSLSQKTAESTPEGGSASYGFDNDGNLLTRTDARSITVTYAYDALHRPTSKNFSDTPASPDVSYFYDQTTYNGLTITNGKGRRTGMTDAAGLEARSYDVMGRVLIIRRTTTGITKDFSYAYNLDGQVKSITYPSGRRIDYTVNAAARPLSAVDTANSVNYATQATYCPCNANTSTKHGVTGSFAGITRSCTYNKRLQHITISAASPTQTVFSLTYDYHLNVDNNGSVRQITNNLDSGRTQTFTYDQLNRVNTAEVPTAWGLSFGYDVWANLLTQTVTKGSAPMLNVTVNNQNKITNSGFSYDAAGNLTNDGSLPYTYDAENRLTSADGVTYTYDGDGLRVQKSTGTLYWYGLSGQVLVETDAAGNNPKEYIFFIGKRIARRDPDGTVYYFFEDDLGSIHVVTNATGTVVDDSDYYPFGGEKVFTDTLNNNYKFTGHERDTESGLDYYQYRMLSTNLGRWTSTDPVMASAHEPQSLNRYGYVVNNPTNLVDPTGQFHWIYRPGYGWCRHVEAFLEGSAFEDFFCFPGDPALAAFESIVSVAETRCNCSGPLTLRHPQTREILSCIYTCSCDVGPPPSIPDTVNIPWQMIRWQHKVQYGSWPNRCPASCKITADLVRIEFWGMSLRILFGRSVDWVSRADVWGGR